MFIYNAWYIAAEPAELNDGRIVGRVLLGKRIALYRGESGQLVAFEDACPHRKAPLSLGTVVGDGVRCAYHGAEFGADGRCIKVPGQKAVPPKAVVNTYPVIERHGYIWVWLGDNQAGADESSIPDGFWVSGEPSWIGGYGHMESIKADYRIINDNLFDITHAEFVHPESFGGQEVQFYRNARPGSEFVDRGMSFEIGANSIRFRVHAAALGDEGGPLWRSMLAQSHGEEEWHEPIDFRMEVIWWPPCYTSFHISVRPMGKPEAEPVEIYNLHAAVPETTRSSHYFYRSVRNYGDASMNAAFIDAASFVFNQDKPILEGQQEVLGERDLLQTDPISFSGDRLPLEGRRILERLLAAERVER
ncbi:MAG TPA: aromatic ring-hydroxylating dioxygenase subunit alpha [Candidatus Binatia bacterium]|nr:aromatic ring-hydroxylating dioxygenase subunit alpha [Candidatus Binatia bacterium]